MEIGLPIVIAREGKWYVASCPLLDIASQGKTEEEVKKNIRALIKEYMKDPDTPKFDIKSLLALSLTTVPITI
ncbi:MAG: type II toxin-antitoxin system HicB family antitoxin [Candidatus Micrarchaeaceae archaeon]|jgi:predicted RNase H-like HicB family nuclease|nr:type II toxin-antitoxin system HicB family antitoxin [Candidatus Micrarchaeota archaeon]HII10044.1 type II toxin-antitoxin system HicB family antitoxin [Candidatus Micrarchaeota archaeon]